MQDLRKIEQGGAPAGASDPSPQQAPSGPKGTVVLSLPVTEQPGDKLGRYKLFQQIGEGGCGVVYMAEQIVTKQHRSKLLISMPYANGEQRCWRETDLIHQRRCGPKKFRSPANCESVRDDVEMDRATA